jgi:TonB family protein
MKQCPNCNEEFADKFGFCPVDGTPLDVAVAEPVAHAAGESFQTAAASAPSGNGSAPYEEFPSVEEETVVSHAAPAGRGEYHLTFLEDDGLTRRLVSVVKGAAHDAELTWPEFKRDPVGFTKRTGYATGALVKKFFRQDYAVPAVVAPFIIFLLVAGAWAGIVFRCNFARMMGRPCSELVAANPYENLEVVGYVENEVPKEEPTPDEGTAGTNKGKGGGSKPKQEKPGGGGGGGREEALPVSHGKPAPGSMQDQILPPSAHPPTIKAPLLPMQQTIKGDSALLPDLPAKLPYGDMKSTSTTPSDGPGTGGGQGTGNGTGQGPGDGRGYGPGRGENVGGGDPNYGGGGPGGGGGGRGVDYSHPFKNSEVTRKAVITVKPEPGFTEEARKNNVTGVVRLRAILSAGGSVQGISVVKGLPDGLTERAISAAKQIRFTPAEKDGRTVSQYVTLEYNFNIY